MGRCGGLGAFIIYYLISYGCSVGAGAALWVFFLWGLVNMTMVSNQKKCALHPLPRRFL